MFGVLKKLLFHCAIFVFSMAWFSVAFADGLEQKLFETVKILSQEIGERNVRKPRAIKQSADFLSNELVKSGYNPYVNAYKPKRYPTVEVKNIGATLRGFSNPNTIVVGAHYDSAFGTPGANDNGTGVAVTLALAELMAKENVKKNILFAFFVNEEPPFFQTADMGSVHFVKDLLARQIQVEGMMSIETTGYFSDESGSQKYPPGLGGLFPETGNFIGVIGNISSARFQDKLVKNLKMHPFPIESASLPNSVRSAGFSDHWAFWQAGIPGVMLTDTAMYRYPHYHTHDDTLDKIDFSKLAQFTRALHVSLKQLAN